jgi:hypothetical protein
MVVISLSCRRQPSCEGLALGRRAMPETAVIVMSVPSCRHCLSAPVRPQFRTRIDNVRGARPVQRYRPPASSDLRRARSAFLHVRYLSSAEPEGWPLSRSSCVEIGANDIQRLIVARSLPRTYAGASLATLRTVAGREEMASSAVDRFVDRRAR